jgi:type IV secretion system protein VirB10
VPLSLINTVSTRNASPGDRVYLESVFPILAGGRIVVPPGSYVAGTVTQVKRPGRVKGKGELFVRFDSLTLPNGVTRDFRATIGALDGSQPGKLDPKEGKVTGDSSKGKDARTIGQTTQAGAGVGALGGWAAGRTGMGLGIGSAAGAAAGLMAVLLTRGDDAMLAKGTTVEMILDRQLTYTEAELAFGIPTRGTPTNGGGQSAGTRLPLSRVPENQ